MSGPFSSAVVSEAVSRTTSFLTGKYSEHRNIHEWIERLVRVRIKFESVVKVSEGFDINIKSLHEWQEKFKEDLCEAEEALSNFRAEIFLEKLNRTVEGGSSSPDQSTQEEGSDDATLVHPASNLREAVTPQVDLVNLPHDPFMQEEGSDEATLVQPASNLREAVRRHVELEENLPSDPFMQEKGSDDATLMHPASNLRETVTRQVDQEANLPHDQPMQEEGSDDATLVLLEDVIRRVELEENLLHDQPIQEEGYDDAILQHFNSKMLAIIRALGLESSFFAWLVKFGASCLNLLTLERWTKIRNFLSRGFFKRPIHPIFIYHLLQTIEPLCAIGRVLKSPKILLGEYLENDKKVSKLKDTVEKLEKTAGDIGDFIELLKLQSKRDMCRKRKRSGVALQGLFLVISLKLQTYALFCYGKDPYLLVIKIFRVNCTVPTVITGDIFIGFIM